MAARSRGQQEKIGQITRLVYTHRKKGGGKEGKPISHSKLRRGTKFRLSLSGGVGKRAVRRCRGRVDRKQIPALQGTTKDPIAGTWTVASILEFFLWAGLGVNGLRSGYLYSYSTRRILTLKGGERDCKTEKKIR